MKLKASIIAVVTLVATILPVRAEYVILSSSFDQEEQEAKLENLREEISPYGQPALHRASNGAIAVAIPCQSADEAKNLRGLLLNRGLAPKDAYIVGDSKMGPLEKPAAKRTDVFIQAAASRNRTEAVQLADQLWMNEHWNGEIQVRASDADAKGNRWYRVVIPSETADRAESLKNYLKAESVIDAKSFLVNESDLGLVVYSTRD